MLAAIKSVPAMVHQSVEQPNYTESLALPSTIEYLEKLSTESILALSLI